MSKEKKKPGKQEKSGKTSAGQSQAAIEAENQPHNSKKEALGRNTRQG